MMTSRPLGRAFAAEWASGTIGESIFVEYDAIDHHVIAFAGELHMHRDTNLDSGPNDFWIEH